MDVFLAKITNRENVDKILIKKEFTHYDIYNFEAELKINSPVFFVLSGDKSKIDWAQGVIGFGRITKEPYDKGYNTDKPRYFKIDIKPVFVLDHPLPPKYTKLHPKYQNELYDVPYVGANHFPNQAIAKTSGKNAETMFHLFEDVEPGSTKDFDLDFLNRKNIAMIKDEFRDYLSIKNKASTVSSYINALDQMPDYLNSISVKCPLIWDEKVNTEQLRLVANFVKQESVLEGGGRLGSYTPKSHWKNGWFISGVNNYIRYLEKADSFKYGVSKTISNLQGAVHLPKPFLLLAGISGTGKTRFVKKQAVRSSGGQSENPDNYQLVAVRPDWHEPSDLLGYVSRITGKEEYVPTDFLRFLIKAWQEVFDKGGSLSEIGEGTRPFWLCLDEMNLAPVEQYFADYLSILESRKWTEEGYSSLPLITENMEAVCTALKGNPEDPLWCAFRDNGGIPLPPNLIVAGTVNMDETTHGFSRKVIDRALTLDFQEFFPNKYDEYFEQQSEPKLLSFSRDAQITSRDDLLAVEADEEGSLSIAFLSAVNEKLQSTPFELAYRALNELLLSVKCFQPKNAESLAAVWDDFMMQKVLPRMEGDAEKLHFDGDEKSGLLYDLKMLLTSEFRKLLALHEEDDLPQRPDLLNQKKGGGEAEPCSFKSLEKLKWMQARLVQNQYTSFWA